MFYNKHMKKCFHKDSQKKQEIDEIHDSLYRFTVKRLRSLEKYGAYHFLMRDFMTNHKDKILDSIDKAKTDFMLGFLEIEKRMNLNSTISNK